MSQQSSSRHFTALITALLTVLASVATIASDAKATGKQAKDQQTIALELLQKAATRRDRIN
ncbi:MAG: hypothetical protein HC769_05260 [Cyanobacteria bacterium CRU_2_1]|nr:hypothetical protein [Cyanobacteria bacterium RU_5_0]NJR58307.1 hypothetical protein [Cyanobacteria bacterium CRU_2_1]